MAETLNTPALPDSTITRRELLATGAAAVATLGIVAGVGTQPAEASSRDFAERCRRWFEMNEELQRTYDKYNPIIDALMDELPDLPNELSDPLPHAGDAPKGGWDTDSLRNYAAGGPVMVMEHTYNGSARTWRTEYVPAPDDLKTGAAELLHIRRCYDAARDAKYAQIHAYEDLENEVSSRVWEEARQIVQEPVFSLQDLVGKFEVYEASSLEADYEEQEAFLAAVMADVRRMAGATLT